MIGTPDEFLHQQARQLQYLNSRLLGLQQINDQLLAGLRELETLAREQLPRYPVESPEGETPA